MFGFLKQILGKSADSPAQVPVQRAPTGVPPRTGDTALSHAGVSAACAASQAGTHAAQPGGIDLPLKAILSSLPLELHPLVLQQEPGDRFVPVHLDQVLPQLSHGTVKIPFGELRRVCPDVFANSREMDNVLVSLPLGEILTRVNPSLLRRRKAQRVIEVPDEIGSPFDGRGRGLAIGKPNAPTAAPSHEHSQQPTPGNGRHTAAASRQDLHEPNPGNGRHTILPKHASPPPGLEPQPDATKPGFAARAISNLQSTPAPKPPAANTFAPPSLTPPRGGNGGSIKLPPGFPTSSHPGTRPLPQPAQPVQPASTRKPIVVGLVALAEAWPEELRKEIVRSNLVDAKVSLPGDVIERSLRQGKILFKWGVIRSWIKGSALPPGSAHEDVTLELPLKVIAPLFLGDHSTRKLRPKVDIDESIPNLFFGFPQPDGGATAAATAKPADTNFYVWDDNADAVRVTDTPGAREPSAGTKFVSKYATPNEIVSRAAALDGVAGALIALPDGLLVASRVPSDFNSDTLAAFLPQIFGKVSQCTKELRMGELNNLNFTVGNVPWKIFRVNAIFFAAFGRAAQPLPTAQLAALAAELDHKPK